MPKNVQWLRNFQRAIRIRSGVYKSSVAAEASGDEGPDPPENVDQIRPWLVQAGLTDDVAATFERVGIVTVSSLVALETEERVSLLGGDVPKLVEVKTSLEHWRRQHPWEAYMIDTATARKADEEKRSSAVEARRASHQKMASMQTPIGPQRTVPSMRREETCDGTAVIVARNLPADKTASELCEFLEESSGLTRLHVSLHARPKFFFEGSTSTLSRLASSEDAAAVRIEHMEGMIRGPAVNARVTPGGWHYEAFAVLEVQQDAASVMLASCQGATFHGLKIMLHFVDVFGPRLQLETNLRALQLADPKMHQRRVRRPFALAQVPPDQDRAKELEELLEQTGSLSIAHQKEWADILARTEERRLWQVRSHAMDRE